GPYSDMNSVMRSGTSLSQSTIAPGSTRSRIIPGIPVTHSAMVSPNSWSRPGISENMPLIQPRTTPSPSSPLIIEETFPGNDRNHSKIVVPNDDSADNARPGSFLS